MDKMTEYLTKNGKARNVKLKYDFMPALLEIIERPSHMAGTVIVIAISALLAAAVIWASLSELDIVVIGIGNILPEDKIVDMQFLTSGKTAKINVKPGDYVKEGDVLIELENEAAKIDLAALEYNIKWCDIRREITENRIADDEYDIPIERYGAEFRTGIKQLILEIDMYKDRKALERKNLEDAEKDLADAKEAGSDYLIPTLENRVKSYEDNMISSAKSQESQMYGQLFSVEREMNGYMIQLEKYDVAAENYKMVSPVNGYVNMMSVASPGQSVSPGNTIVSIIPSDGEMKFECYVTDKDIAEIAVGMDVKVKLTAFSFSDYGAVTGKVTYISPSAFSNEKYGNVYIVDIDIDEDAMNANIRPVSGISGNAEIIVGRRTVLRYFLDPITNGIGESLKEN